MPAHQSPSVEVVAGRLAGFPAALRAAVAMFAASDTRWKPGPEHWSVLEICSHLLDEEREDFRVRLRSTLEDPSRPWASLDLKNIAEIRRYNDRDLASTLDDFEAERAASISWLHSLRDADWSRAYNHPEVGPVSVRDLLGSWAAHDALHLRQISRRLYQLAQRDVPGADIAYAGTW